MGLDQQHSRFSGVPLCSHPSASIPGIFRTKNGRYSLHSFHPPSQEDALKQVADEENPKRRLLPLEERLPVAHASTRVPSVVHRTSLLQSMAHRRHLGEDQRHATRKDTHKRKSQSPTERWHPRHPICEDHQRRRYSGLRWGEEAQRKKAPFAGRYAGYGAQSQSALGGVARSCSDASGAGGTAEEFPRLEHLWVDQGYTGTG